MQFGSILNKTIWPPADLPTHFHWNNSGK